MGQSNWIAAFAVLGFIVFIGSRGEITKYRAVLGI